MASPRWRRYIAWPDNQGTPTRGRLSMVLLDTLSHHPGAHHDALTSNSADYQACTPKMPEQSAMTRNVKAIDHQAVKAYPQRRAHFLSSFLHISTRAVLASKRMVTNTGRETGGLVSDPEDLDERRNGNFFGGCDKDDGCCAVEPVLSRKLQQDSCRFGP